MINYIYIIDDECNILNKTIKHLPNSSLGTVQDKDMDKDIDKDKDKRRKFKKEQLAEIKTNINDYAKDFPKLNMDFYYSSFPVVSTF